MWQPLEPLTPRELEVLEYLALGLENVEIGQHLGLARSSITSMLSEMYSKMGVRNRTQAIFWGVAVMGLVQEWHCANCGYLVPISQAKMCYQCGGVLCPNCWDRYGLCTAHAN